MDQLKIGRFIAAERKRQGLTQRQLAEQLSISDKTISKWECGKGLPEVSLMLPLCKALQIGVNDLLSGERLCEDNYRKRAEENLMNLIEENRENKNRMLYSVLCVGVTVVAVAALVALASFLTIPVPARILLLLLAVLTGVTGIFGGGPVGVAGRILRVPALQGAVCAVDAGLCEGLPHPDPPQADLPALRAHRDVPPPDCAIGKGEDDKGAGKRFSFAAPCFFIWRERVGIEPTYAATNCNYWF